jgi:maltose O-acetyltransferase
MTEREKMLAGELYLASDPALVAARNRARRLARDYNATTEDEPERRRALLRELFGVAGEGIVIEPPFHCDYGDNIVVGAGFYANFGCVILDCAPVRIGHRTLFGPGVHVYAALHPMDPQVRAAGPELARPVTIGDDCWIGGGVLVLPGVTIGAGTTIGAGSVVTRDIPARGVAVGNPCRVLRAIG